MVKLSDVVEGKTSTSSTSNGKMGRTPNKESPKGEKDHRDFADVVECPLCGDRFEQDSRLPEENGSGDKSGHLKCIEHHAEHHPNKEWKGIREVDNQ